MDNTKLWMATAGVLAEKDPELKRHIVTMFQDFLCELTKATEPKSQKD